MRPRTATNCWSSGWRARAGGKISEVSADLFGEVINYLPAGSHDVYVTTADGSEAGLAAAQFPEGEFVLIFGLPQGAPSSLKLTWPGNRQLDISGLVQAGASQAPALRGQEFVSCAGHSATRGADSGAHQNAHPGSGRHSHAAAVADRRGDHGSNPRRGGPGLAGRGAGSQAGRHPDAWAWAAHRARASKSLPARSATSPCRSRSSPARSCAAPSPANRTWWCGGSSACARTSRDTFPPRSSSSLASLQTRRPTSWTPTVSTSTRTIPARPRRWPWTSTARHPRPSPPSWPQRAVCPERSRISMPSRPRSGR